jgi:CheY-like chemotaxis protein
LANAEKRTVLLVDDNEATRTLITAILQRDFQVDTALDGMDAVEKLKTKQYATVLLDLRMPQYDGFSVLDFLKANNPEALRNVIVVTAVLSQKETDRAKAYGICDIIYKPFDVDSFLEKVKKCAGEFDNGTRGRSVFCSSTPMILLIADLLKNRFV